MNVGRTISIVHLRRERMRAAIASFEDAKVEMNEAANNIYKKGDNVWWMEGGRLREARVVSIVGPAWALKIRVYNKKTKRTFNLDIFKVLAYEGVLR